MAETAQQGATGASTLQEQGAGLLAQPQRTLWGDAFRTFRRRKSAMVGLVMVIAFIIASIIGQFWTPHDPYRANLRTRLQGPSTTYIMGTDGFGRDVLSRVLRAAPLALMVGVAAVAIGSVVGSLMGLVAGYFRGWIGAVLMRLTDAMIAFPLLLLALAIMASLGPGLDKVIIAVGISVTPRFSRMMSAESTSVSRREYITAAKAIGSPTSRILMKHVLPNSLSSVLVMATLYVSTAILVESTLSFLGLGPNPPTPTWGSMVNDGADVMRTAPWIAVFPGLAITLVILGFSLAGDGLRDALDTKLRDK
jgi:peptide/nickel transport system permease protein